MYLRLLFLALEKHSCLQGIFLHTVVLKDFTLLTLQCFFKLSLRKLKLLVEFQNFTIFFVYLSFKVVHVGFQMAHSGEVTSLKTEFLKLVLLLIELDF